MTLSKAIRVVWGCVITALSILIGYVAIVYLTEYGAVRFTLAVVMIAVGAGIGGLVYLWLARLKLRRKTACVLLAILVLFLCVPVISMFVPGRVTYSKFGLTMYGIIPVPVLDITVNDRGLLWFRDKTHYVSVKEVRAYLTPRTEAVVIGIGWDGLVRVGPEVASLAESNGVELFILKSPAAFEKYNELRSDGQNVVLIAHSTC